MEGLQVKKINIFLIMTVILLSFFTFFAKDPLGFFVHNQTNSPSLISNFNIDQVQYIKTMTGENQVLLTFERDVNVGWKIFVGDQKEKSYPVDISWLEKGLETIANAKKYQEVSSRKDSFEKFGVTKNSFRILLLDVQEEAISSIHIGDIGSGGDSTFVRLLNSTSVYSVKGRWVDSWDKNLDDFRDKKLLIFSKDNVLKVHAKKMSSLFYTLGLDDAQVWKLLSPTSSMIADSDKANSLLDILENLKGTSFDKDFIPKKHPDLEFDLDLSGGFSLSLALFKKSDGRYVANSSNFPDYMFIPDYLFERLSGYNKETLKKIEIKEEIKEDTNVIEDVK